MGDHLLWTLQHTWEFSADYVGKRRDSSAPSLALEYNFYVPDFFLALQYNLSDLQELYNSDSTFARAFRWLNERGFNPHLDKLEDWLEPPKQEEEPSTLSLIGQGLQQGFQQALELSKKVPDPRISVTAKAIDWLLDKGKQLGQDSLHDLLVYIITEKMGFRMIQLFAHSLPVETMEVTQRKETLKKKEIQALLNARSKRKVKPALEEQSGQAAEEAVDNKEASAHQEVAPSSEAVDNKEASAHQEVAPSSEAAPSQPTQTTHEQEQEHQAETEVQAPETRSKKRTESVSERKAETPAIQTIEREHQSLETAEGLDETAPFESKRETYLPEKAKKPFQPLPHNKSEKKKVEELKPETQQMLSAFRKRRKKE